MRAMNETNKHLTVQRPTYMHLFIFTPTRFRLKEDHIQGIFIVE